MSLGMRGQENKPNSQQPAAHSEGNQDPVGLGESGEGNVAKVRNVSDSPAPLGGMRIEACLIEQYRGQRCEKKTE